MGKPYYEPTIVVHDKVKFCILYTGECPNEKYLTKIFIEHHAAHWKDIGLQLNLNDSALENIKLNNQHHSNHVEECLKDVLRRWLKQEMAATWDKLFIATDRVDRKSEFAEG